jgi:hypothetical protein
MNRPPEPDRAPVVRRPVLPITPTERRQLWTVRSARRTATAALFFGLLATVLLAAGLMWVRPLRDAAQLRKGLAVDAFRVGGGPTHKLAPQDSLRPGDRVQIALTTRVQTRVAVWAREDGGTVRAWYGSGGKVLDPGEGIVLDESDRYDAMPGTIRIAMRVCPVDLPIGDNPWVEPTPQAHCRPYLWTLEKRS